MLGVVLGAHHVRNRVDESQAFQEGDACQTGPDQHRAARFKVVWPGMGNGQVFRDQPQAFQCHAIAKRMEAGDAIGFDCVDHRIDAGPRRQVRRQSEGQFRVQ